MHEEMPRPRDGMMGGFQLWVNLPARLKMTAPRYQDVPSATIPEVVRDGGERLRVVAGEVDGVRGPVKEIYADPSYFDVTVPAGAACGSRSPAGTRPSPTSSRAKASSRRPTAPPAARWAVRVLPCSATATSVVVRGGERPARFLLVSGKPLGEPIARYGPFVMNTREEIEQALRDLRDGTFVY